MVVALTIFPTLGSAVAADKAKSGAKDKPQPTPSATTSVASVASGLKFSFTPTELTDGGDTIPISPGTISPAVSLTLLANASSDVADVGSRCTGFASRVDAKVKVYTAAHCTALWDSTTKAFVMPKRVAFSDGASTKTLDVGAVGSLAIDVDAGFRKREDSFKGSTLPAEGVLAELTCPGGESGVANWPHDVAVLTIDVAQWPDAWLRELPPGGKTRAGVDVDDHVSVIGAGCTAHDPAACTQVGTVYRRAEVDTFVVKQLLTSTLFKASSPGSAVRIGDSGGPVFLTVEKAGKRTTSMVGVVTASTADGAVIVTEI